MATKLYRTTLSQTKQKLSIEISDEYVHNCLNVPFRFRLYCFSRALQSYSLMQLLPLSSECVSGTCSRWWTGSEWYRSSPYLRYLTPQWKRQIRISNKYVIWLWLMTNAWGGGKIRKVRPRGCYFCREVGEACLVQWHLSGGWNQGSKPGSHLGRCLPGQGGSRC